MNNNLPFKKWCWNKWNLIYQKKRKKRKKKETLHLDTDLIFFERKTNKQKNPSTGS